MVENLNRQDTRASNEFVSENSKPLLDEETQIYEICISNLLPKITNILSSSENWKSRLFGGDVAKEETIKKISEYINNSISELEKLNSENDDVFYLLDTLRAIRANYIKKKTKDDFGKIFSDFINYLLKMK